jgi:hypothetical protein
MSSELLPVDTSQTLLCEPARASQKTTFVSGTFSFFGDLSFAGVLTAQTESTNAIRTEINTLFFITSSSFQAQVENSTFSQAWRLQLSRNNSHKPFPETSGSGFDDWPE